jgi:uncharacterized membrane-anchored protein
MGEIRKLVIDFQDDINRGLELCLDDNDVISFVWYEDGDNQRTKKISIAELYSILKEVSDWKEKIKREQTNIEIKGWMNRCSTLEHENEKLRGDIWKLKVDLQALRETIKIVGQK